MEKENLYLIHGEDYLRHIEEKLELLWMATILMHYIKNGAEKDGYLDLVRRSTLDFDERCEENVFFLMDVSEYKKMYNDENYNVYQVVPSKGCDV